MGLDQGEGLVETSGDVQAWPAVDRRIADEGGEAVAVDDDFSALDGICGCSGGEGGDDQATGRVVGARADESHPTGRQDLVERWLRRGRRGGTSGVLLGGADWSG